MATARLILVRHGATVDNKAGRLMGRNDAPLTDEAIEEARRISQSASVKELFSGVDAIWSSPLHRAFETARLLVGGSSTSIEKADELLERDFGIYNGRLLKELWEGDAEWKAAEGDHETAPVNGESLADVERRVFPFLVDLHERVDADKNLILLGHSTVWRLVAAVLNGRRKFPLEEKIAGPLSMQEYPREDIKLFLPIINELSR